MIFALIAGLSVGISLLRIAAQLNSLTPTPLMIREIMFVINEFILYRKKTSLSRVNYCFNIFRRFITAFNRCFCQNQFLFYTHKTMKNESAIESEFLREEERVEARSGSLKKNSV